MSGKLLCTRGALAIVVLSAVALSWLVGCTRVVRAEDVAEGAKMASSKNVVIDLGQTDWINSSGLSILIHHWKKYNDDGGHLRLANLTQKIEKILVISKLTSVFETYETLDEAIASFK